MREPSTSVVVQQIREAYPRDGERPRAETAIAKAIDRIARQRGCDGPAAAAWLLERVKRYATIREEVASREPDQANYVPMAHRWFNGSRFDEDESAWGRTRKLTASERMDRLLKERRMQGQFPEPTARLKQLGDDYAVPGRRTDLAPGVREAIRESFGERNRDRAAIFRQIQGAKVRLDAMENEALADAHPELVKPADPAGFRRRLEVLNELDIPGRRELQAAIETLNGDARRSA